MLGAIQNQISVMNLRVKSYNLVSKKSNFEGSMDVVAGGKYKVSISSNNRPAYYRLHISYSEKVPPLIIGDNSNTNNDQSTGHINERSEPFDPSPNETRNNELNGIWDNNYIAFQIDGNEASLCQTNGSKSTKIRHIWEINP